MATTGDPDLAKKIVDPSNLKKEDALFYKDLADDLYKSENYEHALSNYQLALKCDPADLVAMYGQAASCYMLNDYEKAYESLKASLALEKKAVSYYNQALVLNELHQWDQALESLYAGLALEPSSQTIFCELLSMRISHESHVPYFRPYSGIL